MKSILVFLVISWIGFWFTPDQQGQRFMKQEKYKEAAETFEDPIWQGVAWYRAGEFEKATQSFARSSTAEAKYNLGNSWLMLGKYHQAIESYDEALKKKPNWQEAHENRELAKARAKLKESTGGDLGDQRLGADKVVFDKKKTDEGQETEIAGEQAVSDSSVQAIWLRQVQTQPADFLKSKFAYQEALRTEGESE